MTITSISQPRRKRSPAARRRPTEPSLNSRSSARSRLRSASPPTIPPRVCRSPRCRWQGIGAQMLEHERELAGIDAQLVVRGPRPVGRGLHELAEITEADLLVVGSTRQAVIERVPMRDDCHAALDASRTARELAAMYAGTELRHIRPRHRAGSRDAGASGFVSASPGASRRCPRRTSPGGFLAGEFVHKVKKPQVLDFLDYGTAERRREMCRGGGAAEPPPGARSPSSPLH